MYGEQVISCFAARLALGLTFADEFDHMNRIILDLRYRFKKDIETLDVGHIVGIAVLLSGEGLCKNIEANQSQTEREKQVLTLHLRYLAFFNQHPLNCPMPKPP